MEAPGQTGNGTSPSELTQSGTNQPAEIEPAFAFQRTSVDTDAPQPTLCLHFTKALDPNVDYAPYLVTDRSVALAVQGQRLCIEGLDYGETATVTLLAGLPDADGGELQTDETVSLTFEDRPPVVSFAGNGIILPRSEARGLGVQTVNVDEVSIRITHVTDRALVFKTITEGFTGEAGRYSWTPYDEEPGELASPVYEGVLETPGPTNALTTTLLPIERAVGNLEAGAYYVEARDAEAELRGEYNPARAGRWIIVTDLAAVAYRGATGLDITVRSLETAQPVSLSTVRLVSQGNKILASEDTDREGGVHFSAPLLAGEQGDRPKLVTIEGPTGDFAFLDLDRAPLDLSAQPVNGRQVRDGDRAFLYLDRGIYRPGETVHATALLRDAAGYASSGQPGALNLYRPNGTLYLTERFDRLGQAGSFSAPFTLPSSASRGVWRLSMELDGSGVVGEVDFNVEDFVPQRLALELEADTEAPLTAGEQRLIEARLRFLYGAPGSGLRVTGYARVEADPSPFEGFEQFRFGLAKSGFRQTIIDLPPATSDGEGVATLPLDPGKAGQDAVLPLRLRTVITAEEPGGRAVSDDLRIPYRPREHYVGIRSLFEGGASTEDPVRFEVVAFDRLGTATALPIRWRLIRRDYDYDWFQDEGGQWRWRRSERIVKIAEGALDTSVSGPVPILGPELDWGDYEIILSEGGTDVASMDFWVGYGGRSADGTPAPDSVRVLTPDRPIATGGEVTIAIQAPYAGTAEVVVAGGSVLSLQHIDVPEGGTELTLPVSEEWGAGAYVLASVYTPREPGVQPIPRRAIGAAYIPVDTADRTFDVSLDIPDRVRPGQPLAIGIDAGPQADGETVFATMAAVDEGILLLTKHQTPDPVAFFFGKPRLGIEIYDDYGRLLDPDTGEMGVLRSGGDSIGGAGLSVVPTKTVALFRGPVRLGRDGRGEIEVDIPDFNGELRVMAVLWSRSAIGSGARPLTVRDPVPAELVLPRFLAPGDTALATLTVDNVEGQVGSYAPRVLTPQGSPLTAGGSLSPISLDQGERSERSVEIAASQTGLTEIELRLDGPGDFGVSRSYPIEIRSAFLPETRTRRVALAPGESYAPGTGVFDGLLAGSAELLVSAAPSPIDLQPLTASLVRYPYGCTEQIVSSATPILLKPQRTPEETATLRRAVETLLERQGPDGSFGMWRVGDRRATPWLGAYAVDFLSRAKAQGLPVPDDAMDRAYAPLQPISKGEPGRAYGYDSSLPRGWRSSDTRERLIDRSAAYALYVLARAGRVDRSRLRYMHDARIDEIESPLARAQIGAGLAAIGDQGRARNAFDRTLDALGYRNGGDWYQSPIRDGAAVMALFAEAREDERAVSLLDQIDDGFPDVERLTTQEKAFLVRAAHALSSGRTEAQIRYGRSLVNAAVLTPADDLDAPFTNEGDETIYVTALTRGVPTAPPGPVARGLGVRKRLLELDGSTADPSSVARGERFIIALTVEPEASRQAQLVIADLLPAGFEIEAILDRRDTGPNAVYDFLDPLSRTDITEAGDDRFVASVITRSADPLHFAYIVRAVTPGEFAFPGAVVEDMYRPDRFARSASARLQVSP
ncbi:alpha-2-macroglobulin family protein [Parvularcula lutaonensis]|uniref:Alpha-2-macroglobulin n=1 Tax=Parvularcula lutaonensis TaxID=491923 RepID=A0ABV7MFV3_9PROT|nr:alpha-2-macroglobulin [Parvularcula lutaonensis]GGY55122.1 alpha-2-macroglobulin [Parvularcula lutaonensis]